MFDINSIRNWRKYLIELLFFFHIFECGINDFDIDIGSFFLCVEVLQIRNKLVEIYICTANFFISLCAGTLDRNP